MRPARTVTISLSPELASKADKLARAEGRSRSELFREALRQYIDRRERWDKIFEFGEEIGARSGLTEADVVEAVKGFRRETRA